MSAPQFTILFHGNCIDGWFSAYITNTYLKSNGGATTLYPISPSLSNTWPAVEKMSGTTVFLVDVSVPKSIYTSWLKNGVHAVHCIDHHATSVEHWPKSADGTSTVVDTTRCAALQAWQRFFPTMAVPAWMLSIDRIDRWENPTAEDRCLREVLSAIAHLPVQKKMDEAMSMTEAFLMAVQDPTQYAHVIEQGRQALAVKDAKLYEILQKGSIHIIGQEHLVLWQLPKEWLGVSVFIIDTTYITLDSTEAAYIVFSHYPAVNVFVNYRKKVLFKKDTDGVIDKILYVYSARSRVGFDITKDMPLNGHPSSAGASLEIGKVRYLPFLLTPPLPAPTA
jgi:hypothetical protein